MESLEVVEARPARSAAWIQGSLALGASFLGFAASYLYLVRSQAESDPWALKMAIHMAGWHLILVLTLFPASVLGERTAARAVQATSGLFFLIHAGIALANWGELLAGGPIALLNALSGALFLASALTPNDRWRSKR